MNFMCTNKKPITFHFIPNYVYADFKLTSKTEKYPL